MTVRDRLFEAAVVDGGALGAAAIDIATRRVVAGHAHESLVTPALLDLLLGPARPRGALTRRCGAPPAAAARDLMIAGADRAVYCCVLECGELIVMAAPAAVSLARGWALVRRLAVAVDA